MDIVKQTSTVHTGYLKNRQIKYIVLHYTAGTSSKKGTARAVASMFANPNNRPASADFIIDDAEIVQYNPDISNRYAYAVGGNMYAIKYTSVAGTFYGKCKNNNSISIEMCSSKVNKKPPLNPLDPDWSLSAPVVDKAVELTKYLMQKYKVPADRVIMHTHVNAKVCPSPWSMNEKRLQGWYQFKSRLGGAVPDVKPDPDENGDELDMTIDEMLQKMTDEQALVLLNKARTALSAKKEMDWSKKEGHWKRATDSEIVDGNRPQDFMTREEVVAVLGRNNLI